MSFQRRAAQDDYRYKIHVSFLLKCRVIPLIRLANTLSATTKLAGRVDLTLGRVTNIEARNNWVCNT